MKHLFLAAILLISTNALFSQRVIEGDTLITQKQMDELNARLYRSGVEIRSYGQNMAFSYVFLTAGIGTSIYGVFKENTRLAGIGAGIAAIGFIAQIFSPAAMKDAGKILMEGGVRLNLDKPKGKAKKKK